jgi:molybdopterin-synthase adenylyltransferase
MEDAIDRYSRQILFPGVGKEGQSKLGKSSVVLIGCGALGTIIASGLARAGIGNLKIVDRDFIENHNLQRQDLFDEEDVREGIPKAIAAERRLRKVNSSIEIEGIVTDVNYTNIESLVRGADLILDGLDNFETRFLINDCALKLNIPWVYGGAISSSGTTMTFIPHKTACFRCLTPSRIRSGMVPTCDTAGVISPAPWITGSLQVAQALKLLVGAPNISGDLITIDVWEPHFQKLKVVQRPDCPACQGKYEFLDGKSGIKATSLCGQNAVQILNPGSGQVSFSRLAERLNAVGKVSYNDFMMRFALGDQEIVIFPDGRAIVKNTSDESYARGLYSKYIGG